ncbi:PREDICTED: pentatricopeptide repeat-containing protein At5g56310 [Tarenaya hassleriana]|uniref:pentatricopeptide repeat-containing protein At5g56310 n=1 Tax=Tarenaya hassleriana TaxID=28532 RepID=UPI00053C7406|nr:PREDICTED: pentatricopeptide repeat-containing protein At5g56310 [Tarenaya hassleriana]
MRQWLSLSSLSSPLARRGRSVSTASAAGFFLSSIKIKGFDLKTLKQGHCFMITGGLYHDNLVVSKFIDACSSGGNVRYAYSVFVHQPCPNTYLHNTMIRALSLTDEPESHAMAVMVYRKFRASCLRADTYTFPSVLKVVIRLSDVWLGRQIHAQTAVSGLDSSVHVVTGLIQMYSSHGAISIGDARKVFDETYVRETAVWNALIAGYTRVGDMGEAKILLETMPYCSRNVVSWTTVISGYAKSHRAREAIEMFQRMQQENVMPDEVAVLAALSACADMGALELGEWIIRRYDHCLNRSVAMNNALIDMYAKSGNITMAMEVFESVKEKNVVTWTTIITGLAMHGLGQEVFHMFGHMEKGGVKPNGVTFVAVLSACSHVGMVDLGQWYFSEMRSKYGIKPKIEHYGCMIDLLGRAGLLQEAEELATGMPFEPNAAIWGSLLAASNVNRDLELGERALKHLIELEPDNSGNYMLMSNLYSNLGKWNEARMMRKMMNGIGVKKMTGGSSIGVRNKEYRFISGDSSHTRFNEIAELLQDIDWQSQSNGESEEEHEWI